MTIQTKISPTGEKKRKIIFFWWVVVSNEFVCIFELLNQDKMTSELTPHIEYYLNGNVKVKGQKNSVGQREGIWEGFYENGNISMRTPYKGGKEDGIEEEFYENGIIRYRTPFKDGKIDGIEEWFDKRGNITETRHWKDGEVIETTKH
jgi:antitoxin component YwqK of YwqJK toxin-antitoxin module